MCECYGVRTVKYSNHTHELTVTAKPKLPFFPLFIRTVSISCSGEEG